MPTAKKRKSQPAWSDLKRALADFDRAGLLGLVQDLYVLNKTNQSFLHTRFALGTDTLASYKQRIYDLLFPDWNKPVRIAEAKKAISEYRKAIGRPEGLLELHVFWCESASRFSMEYGYADEGYFDALIHQFEAALKLLAAVNDAARRAAMERLVGVRDRTDVGYGVRDDMNTLLERAGHAP